MRLRYAALGIALATGLALVACSKREAPSANNGAADEPAPPPQAASAVPPLPAEPAAPTATAVAPTPTLAPKPVTRPHARESTPSPDFGQKKVAVHANNRYACTSGEKRENVLASPEPRGARITITGQGPCPGEVHDWAAEVSASRIDVHAAHGTPSKCRCSGTGDLVLRGLDPGTYDVHVNGGFDRPIATRVVVLQ